MSWGDGLSTGVDLDQLLVEGVELLPGAPAPVHCAPSFCPLRTPVQADLAGNVVGRGVPWGHVQSAGGPCIGVSPYSGLYVISPKKIGTILINRVMNSCVDRVSSSGVRLSGQCKSGQEQKKAKLFRTSLSKVRQWIPVSKR